MKEIQSLFNLIGEPNSLKVLVVTLMLKKLHISTLSFSLFLVMMTGGVVHSG